MASEREVEVERLLEALRGLLNGRESTRTTAANCCAMTFAIEGKNLTRLSGFETALEGATALVDAAMRDLEMASSHLEYLNRLRS